LKFKAKYWKLFENEFSQISSLFYQFVQNFNYRYPFWIFHILDCLKQSKMWNRPNIIYDEKLTPSLADVILDILVN